MGQRTTLVAAFFLILGSTTACADENPNTTQDVGDNAESYPLICEDAGGPCYSTNKPTTVREFTKGHDLMWRSMQAVHDIEFTRIEPVHILRMAETGAFQIAESISPPRKPQKTKHPRTK